MTSEAYEARRAAGTLIEKLTPDGTHRADVLSTRARIETYVTEPDWYTPTYVSAQILFDRTGEVRVLLSRIASEAGRVARERLAANYDDYLNCFVRSIKAARSGDELGTRLHAAASADALIRTLLDCTRCGRHITTASPPTFLSSRPPLAGRLAISRAPFSGSSEMETRCSNSTSRSTSNG